MSHYAFFETAIGTCGVAWGDAGILRTALLADPNWPSSRLTNNRSETVPPAAVAHAIDAMTSLLAGAPVDLGDIDLDLGAVSDLERRIYGVTREIRPGETRTYGEIAADVGDPLRARAVGQAMGHNPCPIIIPCHRVLAAGGRSGGFSAPGGIATKRRILAIESVHAQRPGDLFSQP